MDLPKLNLPPYPLKLKKKNGQLHIPCIIRNKDIVLTPEEWVRQNMIRFLIEEKGYPKNLIAVEKQLVVNKMKKRFDLLVYNKLGDPFLLGEFKAPLVNIDESTLKQIINYNKAVNVSYLLLSNGLSHFFGQLSEADSQIVFFENVPLFSNLVN